MEVSMGAKPGGGPIGDMLFDIGSLGEIILAFAFGVAPSKSAFNLFSAASSCAVAASGAAAANGAVAARSCCEELLQSVICCEELLQSGSCCSAIGELLRGAVAANGADAGAAAADP